jgi:5-(carboxyamino)imidazole ribonucleotide synthase
MRVGILGGGQLARMLALAGHPLGLECVVLEPASDACASRVARQLVGAYDDPALLDELGDSDVVTYEFENVPVRSVEHLSARVAVFPPPRALATASDRLAEKALFDELRIPTTRFRPVATPAEARAAVDEVGLPAVLKTRREGYDGKGQVVIRARADIDAAFASLPSAAKILEEFVPFDREVSALAVRARDGATAFYPLTENRHRGGILRLSIARPGDPLESIACDYAGRILEALDYVGVLALELFAVRDGLVANELAPRVHNSGHWTIDAAQTSQFENHLRAILGYPLGSTAPRARAAMINFVGDAPMPQQVLRHPGAHLHLYGKESRPGRKVGHATVTAASDAALDATISAMAALPGVDLR